MLTPLSRSIAIIGLGEVAVQHQGLGLAIAWDLRSSSWDRDIMGIS